MVAMAWAEHHPEDLAGLVLINASSGRVSGPMSRMRPWAFFDMVSSGLVRDPVRRERQVLGRLTNLVQGERAETMVAERARIATARPARLGTLFRQMVAGALYRGPKQLAVPALVVVSEADRLVSPSCSHRLAAWHDLPLVSHPEAGHDTPIDDPEWTSRVIGAWLPSAESAAGG
jgi:pimeloyl-ACP methyl ester carboxylesterase